MLPGMSMNDLVQFASPKMKRFEPLPRPLVRVFVTYLAKVMGVSVVPGEYFKCCGQPPLCTWCMYFQMHSEDSPSCSTSIQLFLDRLVFISALSISQAVSRKSCYCF